MPDAVIGGRNLPATIVPGNPGFDQTKLNSLRPSGSVFLVVVPLPTAVYSAGTRMCISAVKRSVNRPVMGNQRPA